MIKNNIVLVRPEKGISENSKGQATSLINKF